MATAEATADTREPAASAAPVETAAPAETTVATAQPSAEPPKPATKTFPLAEFKLPLAIDLPESATLEASKSKDKLGGVNAYHDASKIDVRIFAAPPDMATAAAIKAKLSKLAAKPATSFVKEEGDLLVYERKGGSFGFVSRASIGGKNFLCQGDGEAQTDLEAAIAACKTLKSAK